MSDGLLNVVIITKKNTSLRFLHTIESIKSQLYTPIGIIVVDLNEQNSMYSLGLQEDISLNPEIEYINLEPSLSTAEIKNYLLDNLEGEYIAFLNCNDSWDIGMALSQIENLKNDSTAVAACVNGILIDERKSGSPVEPLREDEIHDPSKWVLYNPAMMSSQIIYKTNAVIEAGGFDKEFDILCDADMILRLSKKNKVIVSSSSLCECRLTSIYYDYELKLFNDYKYFKIKHMDYLLVDKRLSQGFYAMMIDLAKINYRWLDLIVYMVMYFIKGPFHTIGLLLEKLGHIIYCTIRWVLRKLSIIKSSIQIKINIIRILWSKVIKPKNRGKIAHLKKEGLTLTFLSAKEYNEHSSLTYGFNNRIEKVVIPDHVTVIKKGMFYNCSRLITVEIPDTVQEIQAHGFQNCSNLRNVIFRERGRLSKIGDYAFAGCESLREINLPLSVTQIGAYSFAGCHSLTKMMFNNKSLFPSSIEKISKYTFVGCKSLMSVEFEANSILEVIEEGAFLGCYSLGKVILTGRVRSLGAYALAYCKSIESVALLQVDSLETIGKGALMHCKSLPYFQLSNSLERIRSYTFYGCSNLKSIKIPKKVLSINSQAFRKCSLLSDVLMLSGDIMISGTGFDNHTKIVIQDIADTDDI